MIRLDAHSDGYRLLRVDGEDLPDGDDGPRYLMLHRLTLYAQGVLDSPRFDEDPREVHHVDRVPSHNSESNLDALDPVSHGSTTRAAQTAHEGPERVGVRYVVCGSCSTRRPQYVRVDGSRLCAVCSTVSEVDADDDVDDADDRRLGA